MLKYLWMVTEDLFMVVTLTTWMHAVLSRLFGRRARLIHGIGLGVGVVAAVTFTLVKSQTNKIMDTQWNHYTYAVIVVLTALFVLLALILGRHEGRQRFGVPGALVCGAGACLSAVLIFYYLPDPLLDMVNFNTMGQGWISAYFGVRLGGWALALILLYVYSRCMFRCADDIKPFALVLGALLIGALAVGSFSFMRFFNNAWSMRGVWKNWPIDFSLPEYRWVKDMVLMSGNTKPLFFAVRYWIAAALAALMLIVYFWRNTRVTQPYDNPAQRRKLRAINRRHRRLAAFTCACVVFFGVVLNPIKAYDTREIVLSAAEQYVLDEAGGRILIPLQNVSDGHLHRYEYPVGNKTVRWIVVKKPGSASFGVGLDACDVCGDAGYYERGGQVICKRCDVVMNINTIGFKGGCNPIPLAYEVRDGSLVFKLSDIIAGEKEFR